ncbi:Alcohol dehydrogenase GroES-like domain family protein [Candida parapsilosis]|uniref:Alcohol dehydrogenase GroES-like domain family protein n=1 Tax=Candida parapsilosis TaxID=5480 RepID=A0A8X7NIY9_CANPA|nr:Alcohol dehydrogenase GroES-like domain family protein [Candida parapsilosis]KAF6042953.1 Alcohol dehydrogenase GroES-like domain family protein [Candida parapsilosis]
MSESEQVPPAVSEVALSQEAPSYEEAVAPATTNSNSTSSDTTELPSSPTKPKKKSVGFAPPPEEDLREYHKYLKQKEEAELKSSPFHKIPPELAYLEKRNKQAPPKPIDQPTRPAKPNSRLRLTDLPDLSKLKFFDVKDLSVQNKETELQFHYTTIDLPPSSGSVLVDVNYGSLNSFDLSKVNQYLLNMSNVKVVLGYEFAGVITHVGSSMQKKFAVGDYVFGLIDPTSRRGALSSSQIIYPGRDVLVKVDENVLNQLNDIDIDLDANDDNKAFEVGEEETEATNLVEQTQANEISTSSESEDVNTAKSEELRDAEEAEGVTTPSKSPREENKANTDTNVDSNVDDLVSRAGKSTLESKKTALPPLAKLSAISLLYNRAKQMLQSLNSKNKKVNILINGADTDIGLTIIQVLLAEYQFEFISLILIIREKSLEYMDNLLERFEKKYYDPSTTKRLKCISFDVVNDGLYFPGERVPISYKKPDFFATEVIDALLVPHGNELIDKSNVNEYKLDLFIDLIGCKKYFQSTSTKLHEIETLNMPFKQNISTSIENLFDAKTKEPFLTRILKPKKLGSAVVSGCKFTLREPSYNIDKLIDFSEQGVLNPWTSKWSSNILNNWTSYNYYEEIYLKIKQKWAEQALQLVLDDKLKFKIDKFVDWRKDYKKYVKALKENDGKIILEVEEF